MERRAEPESSRGRIRAPVLLLCIATGALSLVGGCGERGRQRSLTEWRFAIEEITGSVQDAYAQELKRRIEKGSGGRIHVTVYPYGTLGTSDQITEQVHLGAVQLATASPGHIGKMIPELQAFLLHFVLSDDAAVNERLAARSVRLREAMDRLYARKGFKFLALVPEGEQVWTTNRPVRKPEDFSGLKIRVMTSPVLLAAYSAYGANPTPMPYAEVYSGLQLSMIDAQVNPVFAIEEMSFYEVTDYLIFAGQSQFVTTAIANRRFHASLPEEDRQLLEQTVADLNGYIFAVQQQYNAERLKLIEQKKPSIEIIRLSEKERSAFRKASRPLRRTFDEIAGESGARFLDLLLEEVAAAEAGEL